MGIRIFLRRGSGVGGAVARRAELCPHFISIDFLCVSAALRESFFLN